jgi:bacillithiol system protein YtxJ
MNWNTLTQEEQLETLVQLSYNEPIVIFKHSTRCSISSAALDRLERKWDRAMPAGVAAWYLDLIAFRNISNAIAKKFNIEHQSPQLLLIKNGECVYHASHYDISAEALANELNLIKS